MPETELPQTDFEKQISEFAARDQYRSLQALPEAGGKITVDGEEVLNFSSNDYLNLSSHPAVIAGSQRAASEYGCGSTASRLMTGNLDLHEELEKELAQLVGQPAGLLFGSGFLTNVGVITALVGRGDAIFADRLNHASLVDGARLSGATVHRYQHNDLDHLEKLLNDQTDHRRRVIVSDSLFSMDGDLADIPRLSALAKQSDCLLMVDEAHAIGIFGEGGGGLCRDLLPEGRPDVIVGTLGKALGCYGGFAACSETIRSLLINKARTFIYSTALPPPTVGSALAALEVIKQSPDLGSELLRRARLLRDLLAEEGFALGESESQIIPVMVGENERAQEFSEALKEEGLLAVAVRPPTVPEGTARLRLSVTLAHQEEDLEKAAGILGRVVGLSC